MFPLAAAESRRIELENSRSPHLEAEFFVIIADLWRISHKYERLQQDWTLLKPLTRFTPPKERIRSIFIPVLVFPTGSFDIQRHPCLYCNADADRICTLHL